MLTLWQDSGAPLGIVLVIEIYLDFTLLYVDDIVCLRVAGARVHNNNFDAPRVRFYGDTFARAPTYDAIENANFFLELLVFTDGSRF